MATKIKKNLSKPKTKFVANTSKTINDLINKN